MSVIKKKQYEENPEARKKQSERLKKHHEENPETGKKHSERLKKHYEENPEARKDMSKKTKKYYEENPEAIKEKSENTKKYFKENPETKKKILDTKGKNKPFDIFTKDGIFIKTCNYQFEAIEYLQKEYGITKKISVGSVLRGKSNSSAGFIFKYK